MQFSVVIPAYKAAHQLRRAIDGCLMQELQPFEIIVVDDASPELPAETVRDQYPAECASGKLKIVSLPINGGPSVARNIGWEVSSGDFVAFLDADDCWDRDRLTIVAGWLHDDPQIDWLAHRYRLPGEVKPKTIQIPSKVTLNRLLVGNVAQTSCVVVRRSIPMRFNPAMRHCEDYDLWLRIAASGYELRVSETPLTELGRPQLTAGGLSGNRWAMRRGEMRAYYHLSQMRPMMASALPILISFSLMKHLRKSFLSARPQRTISSDH